MDDQAGLLTLLVGIALGSGTGGVVGAYLSWKRLKLDIEAAKAETQASLKSIEVDQFKAMFPGGLGDAVEHWRDEARELYIEVDQLRNQRVKDHQEILKLRLDLNRTQSKLSEAERKIQHLESKGTPNV